MYCQGYVDGQMEWSNPISPSCAMLPGENGLDASSLNSATIDPTILQQGGESMADSSFSSSPRSTRQGNGVYFPLNAYPDLDSEPITAASIGEIAYPHPTAPEFARITVDRPGRVELTLTSAENETRSSSSQANPSRILYLRDLETNISQFDGADTTPLLAAPVLFEPTPLMDVYSKTRNGLLCNFDSFPSYQDETLPLPEAGGSGMGNPHLLGIQRKFGTSSAVHNNLSMAHHSRVKACFLASQGDASGAVLELERCLALEKKARRRHMKNESQRRNRTGRKGRR